MHVIPKRVRPEQAAVVAGGMAKSGGIGRRVPVVSGRLKKRGER